MSATPLRIPLVNLQRRPAELDQAVEAAALRVLRHRRFILGPEVAEFEAALSQRFGGVDVISVSSGTDALMLCLQALGVQAGDRVITSPFSFFATVGAILRLGARPQFVDISLADYGMDFAKADLARCADAKALMPVHLFGACTDLSAWQQALPQLPVIEDACQAIDSTDAMKRRAGTIGTAGCFSFFPTKNLGGAGDSGCIITRDAELAAQLRRLRVHGQESSYVHTALGANSRMDTLQAAILLASLPFLDAAHEQRRENAARYDELFAARGMGERILTPQRSSGHTVHQYVVRIPRHRDAVLAGLKSAGIGAAVYYPTPLPLQPCCRMLGHQRGEFPVAEQASAEVLALPVAPGILPDEQEIVVSTVCNLVREAESHRTTRG